MIYDEKCNSCQEPTKRAVGCWDGKDGSHGMLFECESKTCKIALMNRERELEVQRHRQQIRKINADNGVDPKALRTLYLQKGQSMRSAATLVGCRYKIAIFSDYMNERKPFPPELYCKIMDWLESLPDKEV